MTVDLRVPDGREVFLRLAEWADVVITNFAPGTMDAWGLGYRDVAARNPRVVYAAGSTFGTEGTDAAREGADLSAQAAGGLISTTGRDGHEVTPVGATIADHIASQNLVTVDPQQELDEALRLMAQHQVRRLPVVEEDGKLVGIVAQADVARHVDAERTGEVVEQISE